MGIEIYVAVIVHVPPPHEARYLRSYTTTPFTVELTGRVPAGWAYHYAK